MYLYTLYGFFMLFCDFLNVRKMNFQALFQSVKEHCSFVSF